MVRAAGAQGRRGPRKLPSMLVEAYRTSIGTKLLIRPLNHLRRMATYRVCIPFSLPRYSIYSSLRRSFSVLVSSTPGSGWGIKCERGWGHIVTRGIVAREPVNWTPLQAVVCGNDRRGRCTCYLTRDEPRCGKRSLTLGLS